MAKPSPVYIVDGSAYIYRAYHAIRPLANREGLPTHAIFGFTNIFSGRILIGDGTDKIDITKKSASEKLRDAGIAYILQDKSVFPAMTVEENLWMGGYLMDKPEQAKEKAEKIFAKYPRLAERRKNQAKVLSGGERRLLEISRALVMEPEVLLYDEPLSNLDAKLRVQMRTEISKLHQRLTTTMIYVTHDQTEAMTMGDRIVVMKDGYVLQVDTPLKLYHHPKNKFVAGFIGSPAMNFLEGTFHKSGGLEFRDGGGVTLRVSAQHARRLVPHGAKDVILGIRPEDISIGTSRGKAKVRATVEVVEPMGNELYLYFTTREKGAQHVARLDASAKVRVGMAVDLVFDMTKAHFFDRTTEQAL